MKSAPKILKLLGQPKQIIEPITFPLSQQTQKDIKNLQYSFRNSFDKYKVYSLGLAAPQIGVNKRFFIMPKSFHYGELKDFSKLKYLVRQFIVYINPTILWKSDDQVIDNQYCFSVEDCEYKVRRPRFVEVKYYNEDGREVIEKLKQQLRSRCFQHQSDHLDGILVSDIGQRIPPRSQRKKKLIKNDS